MDLVVDRDGTIRGYGEPKDQLLQIRPVVLVLPVGDPRLPHRAAVVAAEGDGRGVVVHAASRDLELPEDVQRQSKPYAPAALRDNGIEHPGDPVIVEAALLLRREPECRRLDWIGPLGDAVERRRRVQDVVDQGSQSLPVLDGAHPAAAHEGTHGLLELEPLEEVRHDGMRPQEVGDVGSGALTSNH